MEQKDKLAEARKALLAKRLKRKSNGVRKAIESISILEHDRPVPLSLAQQRFWITHQLDESKGSHNVYEGWRVKGSFDVSRLNQAFRGLVARHTTLQTQFTLIDDAPHQSKHPLEAFKLEVIDLAHSSTADLSLEIDQLIHAQFSQPFNLLDDPLIRLSLVHLNQGKSDNLLLLTVHHIISDEYSNGIIWRDLSNLYQNLDHELADLPIQYRDFSEWQKDWIEKDSGKKQLNYWKDQLSGEITNLQLPLDNVRQTAPTGQGNTISHLLPRELSDQVASLSKQTQATPFIIWMAIFQLLLHRYTQQDDIWVGTPIGNRQRPEVKNLVGLFLNSIVIRTQLSGSETFTELLKKVQSNVLSGLANQDVPFDQVVNEVQPDRSSGLTPLFQTMLVYANKGAGPQFSGLSFEKIDYKSQFAKLDLTLFVQGGDRPKASIQYNTDLFESSTIRRVLGHLEVMALAIFKNPSLKVSEYPLLTLPEKEQILVDWNANQPAPNAKGKLLHSLILAHAKTKFNHPAVICGDQKLTYRELDLQSGNLARHLQALGVNGESNQFVGVMVDRRPEMLIGILAILRAGGAYVPIDPDYPAERIEHIVTDANVDIILTTGDYKLPESISKPINLINLSEPLQKMEMANLSQITPPSPQALAYVIYTSGSTGKPKGVMVTHTNIVHSTTVRYSVYDNPAERFLLLSSFAFDSSMVGIFWTLCQGGTLILPEQGMHQNVGWLTKTIEAEEITHLLALPSLYQILLDESRPDQLKSLNTVMVAGEACHASLVEKHYSQYPDSALYNEYGPTEGTVWSHAYRFPKDFVGPTVPIGTHIPNVTQYIVDQQNQAVPIGVPGELIIGGAGITPGYLNKPELTAERFVSLPHFDQNPDARFYRTGDLVKWRADGQVIFLGRVDHQVKIRGFRVELGEIEATLLNYAGIKTAAVSVIEKESARNKILAAWFTAESQVDQKTLKEWMGNHVPDYMVPAVFTQLETMPLNANGKINRAALPVPEIISSTASKSAYEAPANQTETSLSRIWQSALNIDHISVNENFFDLGGHSLLAIKIFAQIEKQLG
ncbi:MAG: amino acid adenylation domain-containing protein, partial [Chloroflexota bacterium]